MARIEGTTIGRDPQREKRQRLKVGQGVPGGRQGLPDLPRSAAAGAEPQLPRVSAARSSPLGAIGGAIGNVASAISPPSPIPQGRQLPRAIASQEPVQAPLPYKGAAVLRRGSLWEQVLRPELKPELRPREKRVLDVLERPDELFNPDRSKELQAIVRPSPVLRDAIEADPKLSENRQKILAHLTTSGITKLPAQDLIASMKREVGLGKMSFGEFVEKHKGALGKLSSEEQLRFADEYQEVEEAKRSLTPVSYEIEAQKMSLAAQADTGILSNLSEDVVHAATGFVPGLVVAGTAVSLDARDIVTGRDLTPGRTAEIAGQIGEAYAYQYGPLFRGDFGEFYQRFKDHPLGPVLDFTAIFSLGAGATSRIGAGLAAVKTMREMAHVTSLGDSTVIGLSGKFSIKQAKDGMWNVRGADGKLVGGTFASQEAAASFVQSTQGGRFTVRPAGDGLFDIRSSSGAFVSTAMPTEKAAIHHAQSLATGGLYGSHLQVFLKEAAKAKNRGALIDLWDKHRRNGHEEELAQIADDILEVLDPGFAVDRRAVMDVVKDTLDDVEFNYATRYRSAKTQDKLLNALKDSLDFVRLGAIYMRPAYIANNWVGNTFMNLAHQGPWAVNNLAKSLYAEKVMERRYLVALDHSMGKSASQAVYHHKGIVSAASQPLVQGLSAIADIPFRRSAFFHEARRDGLRTIKSVEELFDKAAKGDERALNRIAEISRKAQEEIVKFGRLSERERNIFTNLIFVYNWMRGASRYAVRFPLQHPVQTAMNAQLGQVGHQWVEEQIGGLPWYMLGSIPVGKKANGDPILVNPFALHPLSTGMSTFKAVIGTAKIARGESFSKFGDEDVVSLFHPVWQAYLEARGGGAPMPQRVAESIAPYRLFRDLKEPGRGSIFPGTRLEAITRYVGGGLAPRRASQEGISTALEREASTDPIALVDVQVKNFTKQTGEQLPEEFVGQLRADAEMVQEVKDFKHDKAGLRSYRSLPPKRQAEIALEFLVQYKYIDQAEAAEIKAEFGAADATTLKEVANALWASTGIGEIKDSWNELRKVGKQAAEANG